jgi:hypothetical protein
MSEAKTKRTKQAVTRGPNRRPRKLVSRAQGQSLRKGMAEALQGVIPAPPDFTAATHKSWRKKLEALTALVEARDLDGLRAFQVNPILTSPKALARYRDCAIAAIEAQARR